MPRNLLASIKSVVATKTSLIATMEKNSKKPVITKINLIFIAFSEVSQINICFAKFLLDLILLFNVFGNELRVLRSFFIFFKKNEFFEIYL